MLTELAEVISKTSSVIEKSQRMGKVTEDWRKANATPAFRKNKKEEVGNYRAVSPNFILGKLNVISKQVEVEGPPRIAVTSN